jgi:hypothetical protein
MISLAPARIRRITRAFRPQLTLEGTAAYAPPASVVSVSALDRVLIALGGEHHRHVAGPIFPCPQCFTPRLAY